MIFKNLTHRPINVVDDNGKIILALLPDVKEEITSYTKKNILDHVDGIPVVNYIYELIQDLPDPVPGVVFVVKYAVLKALNGSRPDVVAPDTNPAGVHRDETGKVIAVKQFQKL